MSIRDIQSSTYFGLPIKWNFGPIFPIQIFVVEFLNMPMDRSLYPDDWDAIATKVKTEVEWRCEQCGRPCRKPGEREHELFQRLPVTWLDDWFETVDSEEFGEVEVEKPGRFILTVAHLDHRPENCNRANLKALCAPCHCRYDLQPSSMFIKQQLKFERHGQLRLEVG